MSNPWETIQFSGVVYGNPGTEKTRFAAQLPKPAKVFCFDPAAKVLAYRQQGLADPVQYMEDGGMFQFVRDPESKQIIVELEYFVDLDPTGIDRQKHPCAYERFQSSLIAHLREGWTGTEQVKYASVILDSYTFCELACFRMQKYKINPLPMGMLDDSKHNQMQWSGHARSVLNVDIISTFPWIPCHNLILAHVDAKKYDEQTKSLWGVNAIGQLGAAIPGAFSEVYYCYKELNEKTKQMESRFLTETDGTYMAQTHIMAPSGCLAQWPAIWANQH